jgi:hypothetical protein
MALFDVSFQAKDKVEAFNVRQDLLDKYGDLITGSGSDPRQKRKYWYDVEVKGALAKNKVRRFLERHDDVLKVKVRKGKTR